MTSQWNEPDRHELCARRDEMIRTRKQYMLTVNGKPVWCVCGGNVFHKSSVDRNVYICNACAQRYEGTPLETGR